MFAVSDVYNAVGRMKLGKCPELDGLHMEAYRHGGRRLCALLRKLFNVCMKCGYVPYQLRSAVIVPLSKCKSGSLSDGDSYRAITVSNSISKVLESLLFKLTVSEEVIDDYQFAFQKSASTALCTHVFKSTVDYYRMNGSHVFCCFIDFRKAFDSVNYWLLFSKLIDSNCSQSCLAAARVLAHWYSNQQVADTGRIDTQCFGISRAVRQGGMLAPYLIKLYARDLLKAVVTSNIGCNIAGCMVNILTYADNMVVLSTIMKGLVRSVE